MHADANEEASAAHPRRVAEAHLPAPVGTGVRAYWRGVLGAALHHIPVLLLLTCLTAIVHTMHWRPIERAEGSMMRWVVRTVGGEAELAAPEDRIGLLEVTARMRLESLELSDGWDLDDNLVKHLDGIRPIERAKMAELLERLALRLQALDRQLGDRAPANRVLAIDVDLAPLDDSPKSRAQGERIRGALDRLREHAHVIVIVLGRETDRMQAVRNDFMREAGCSPFVPDAANPALKGLYFASAWLFERGGGYPLRFPTSLKHGSPSIEHPSTFPLLGTLIHLRRKSTLSAEDRRTLTMLCEQARTAGVASPAIFDDKLAQDNSMQSLVKLGHYKQAHFNWILQNTRVSGPSPIVSLDAIGPGPLAGVAQPERARTDEPANVRPTRLGDQRLMAPVLVLAIQAAGRNDHFGGAFASAPTVSGAMLHSLQAASLAQPLNADPSVPAILADLGIGLLFVLACAMAAPLLRRLSAAAPLTGFVCMAAAPLLFAWLLVLLSRQVAAGLMNFGEWFNPALVIMGLALHAYLQGREPVHEGVDWTFGVRPSVAALSSAGRNWRAGLFTAGRGTAMRLLRVSDLLLWTAVRVFIVAAGALIAVGAVIALVRRLLS